MNAPQVRWAENGEPHHARWRSERNAPPPARIIIVDDATTADHAYGLAAQGTGLLWRGDFQNARQMLTALAARVDRRARKSGRAPPATPVDTFNRLRQARSQRARTLGMLLIPVDADYGIPLRRAPDVRVACSEAWGAADGEPSVTSLRDLLGLIGAHEWRRRGVAVQAIGASIHPHYGVFAPIRGDYVELVAAAPLPAALARDDIAFDIGTGTGVLAAILSRRGVERVVATDNSPRALACARDNIERLGLAGRVTVEQANLFPEGRAALIVCNPPWVPARAGSLLEQGVYDEDSGMLKGFLHGLAGHLVPDGEGWLVLSDLAEHLGLRSREQLADWIAAAGLVVAEREDMRPRHPKAADPDDPLHAARSAEIISLWRLVPASAST